MSTATLKRRQARRRRPSSRGRVPSRRAAPAVMPLGLQVALAGLAGSAVAVLMVVVF